MDGKIDLKDVISYKSLYEKYGLNVQFKNDIKLVYGIRIKINKEPIRNNHPSISPKKDVRSREEEINGGVEYANIESKKILQIKSSTFLP